MAKTFEQILVPYNGTTGSQKAYRKAISIAQAIDAKVTVITCLEERPTLGFIKTKKSKREFEKERTAVEKQHKELEDFAIGYNITYSSKIVKNGLASMRILEFAKVHDIDLIVMAKTKISSSYERMHYQSTIENVLRNAHCAVLVL